jgi:hypothetical protein
MQWAEFSLALIGGYALTRAITEQTQFHLRKGRIWIHHWMLGAAAMAICLAMGIDHPAIWGGLTGVSLEGLGRKNWGLLKS